LGTRYIKGSTPHWTSIDPDDFGKAFVTTGEHADFEELIVYRVDETSGPQIKVCLLDSTPSAVAVTMNHMICDAAAFKEYLYFLCGIYSKLTANSSYRLTMVTGDRSIRGVLKNVSIWVKLRSLLSQSGDSDWGAANHRFPLSDDTNVHPFILTRKIDRERTNALMDYCRTRNATMNDIILAAYYRCLFRGLSIRPSEKLSVPVMVDMRRYLNRTGRFSALTNLSSTVVTRLEFRPDEPFEATLGRVKANMDDKKAANIGINAFIKVSIVSLIAKTGVLKSKRAQSRLRSSLKHPFICMTNVGVLDSTRLSFGGLRPRDAFLCGAIKYKPYFQLALSSYEEELTLSANLYGSLSDKDRILSFFHEIENELRPIWSQPRLSCPHA
jgi:NRPS condensation-like uncharacterized protein